MARLSYSARAFANLDRLTDFLMESDPAAAGEAIDLIAEAVSILKRHPLIGRPIEGGAARACRVPGQDGSCRPVQP